MTGSAALLPGTPVLLDTDDKWANRPLRGQRGVIVHRYEPAIGSAMGADVVVCVGPCGKAAHTVDCHTAVAFKQDEVIPAVPGGGA